MRRVIASDLVMVVGAVVGGVEGYVFVCRWLDRKSCYRVDGERPSLVETLGVEKTLVI